jgi:hypothetical protein
MTLSFQKSSASEVLSEVKPTTKIQNKVFLYSNFGLSPRIQERFFDLLTIEPVRRVAEFTQHLHQTPQRSGLTGVLNFV